MAFDGVTMTTKGINLQTKVQAGETLNFTKIEVGDGVLSSDTTLASLTDLIESKLEVNIESVTSLGDGTYRVRGTFTNSGVTTGFFLREVGVFATDPDDGEILYAVANAGDECDYLPAGGGSTVVTQVVDIITAVGSASSVTATIDDSAVLLSLATFTTHQEASPIDHPDSSVTTAKLADSAVTTAKLADENVTTDKLSDSSVTTAKLADSAVTDAKIGSREIDDTVEAASGAGVLTNLLSKIGYMIKAITGQDDWYTAPDVNLAEVLPLAGGTMSGAIVMGSNKITGMADGSSSGDAVHYGQFANSIASNGYTKLPNGLILQWGAASATSSAGALITLPITFPTACLSAVASACYSNSLTSYATYVVGVNGISASQIRISIPFDSSGTNYAATVRWFAVGN